MNRITLDRQRTFLASLRTRVVVYLARHRSSPQRTRKRDERRREVVRMSGCTVIRVQCSGGASPERADLAPKSLRSFGVAPRTFWMLLSGRRIGKKTVKGQGTRIDCEGELGW